MTSQSKLKLYFDFAARGGKKTKPNPAYRENLTSGAEFF
jgi:hypothetical protein